MTTTNLRWRIAAVVIAAAGVLAFTFSWLAREPVDRVTVTVVPHQEPHPDAPQDPHQDAPAAPEPAPGPAAAPIAWTVPEGWTAAPLKPMRAAVFTVALAGGATGECGVFILAGGGDRLANVNRWRGQAGLPPIDAAALDQELASDTCPAGPFAWLTVKGAARSFLAAMLTTPAGQCFVKLEAPADRLAALQPGFLAFCRSLRPAAP